MSDDPEPTIEREQCPACRGNLKPVDEDYCEACEVWLTDYEHENRHLDDPDAGYGDQL